MSLSAHTLYNYLVPYSEERWSKKKVYGFLKETVTTIIMVYKDMKAIVHSPNGDTDYYKKITSYPLDSCVPGYREAEGRGRRQDGRDLST